MAEPEKKPFWSGLSATVKVLATAIGAGAALIGALAGVGVIGGGKNSAAHGGTQNAAAADWTSQANKICAQANDTINALPDPKTLNIESGAKIGRQAVRISQQMFRDLAALPKPAEKEAQIDN